MTGQEYRAIRIGQELTQLQLANLLGVDPSTVQRREGAETIPREQELALMRVAREKEEEAAKVAAGS